MKAIHAENFIKKLGEIYHAKTGLTADFYLPGIGDGARKAVISRQSY
ncbi:MAG: hypothetical protein MZV63_23280 [Marinilabiliales bacterium]|nr:hypothetical protein [Marinilabiliales bacterium]